VSASFSEAEGPDRALQWDAMLAANYHLKRERFLDGIDRFAQVVGILGGATAFAGLVNWSQIAGAVVASVSAITLCYSPALKARRHAELARDYFKLLAEIARTGLPMTDERRSHFNAEMSLLQSQEPAALRCLVRQVENELHEAFGLEVKMPLRWWQRLFMNAIDLDPSWLPRVKEAV
jgi:hypothetical protein